MGPQPAHGIVESFPTFADRSQPTAPSFRRAKFFEGVVMLLAMFSSSFAGQFSTQGAVPASYARRVWSTADGLPQNTVNVTLQTRDGFLWVGTNAGLARFDGARFRTFGLQDGLRSVRISSLAEDAEGALWIGTTGGGVTRHMNRRFESFGTDNGFPTSADVNTIVADAQGSIWIGTAEGLVEWREGIFTMMPEESGLPRKQVRALAADAHGTMWVSVLGDSLYEGRNGRFSQVTGEGPVKGDVYGLMVDRENAVWAGAGEGKLWRRQGGAWQLFDASHGLPRSSSASLTQDRSGAIWFGGNGVYRLSGDRFVKAIDEPAFEDLVARGLTADREGCLWFGIGNEGLFRLSPRVVQYWGSETGIGARSITSFLEDAAGIQWASTNGGGVFQLAQDRFTPVDAAASASHPHIYTMTSTMDGSIWAGGEQCLLRYRRGEPVKEFSGGLFRGEALRALSADGDTLWIGTYHSTLLKLDDEGISEVAPRGSFNGSITCIVPDGSEALWIGSFGALHRWENGKTQTWTKRHGLLSSSILAIHREPDGTLWLGTQGGGLARMKGGQFVHLTSRNGLIDDVISQILADDRGAFWLGTNRGIMRIERSELEDAAEGRISELHPIILDRNDGLIKEQCSNGHSPTAYKARDGRLYFPMTRGLAAVDPNNFPVLSSDSLKVMLDGLVVDRLPKPIGAENVFAPGSHRVEIDYTVPALRGGDWVRFRHRLDGLDKDWISAGGKRQVTYDGLAPGKYVFRIAARDGQGTWQETGQNLAFTIQPHAWQTLWFRAGGAALLAIGASAAVWSHQRRKHERHLRELERERQQQADLAHAGRLALLGELSASLAHELKQPLAAILSNAQAGLRFLQDDEVGEVREILSDIATADRRASEIISRMRDMIRKGEAQLEKRDLNADLHQVLLLVRSDLEARDVSVDTRLAPGIPMVCGDHIQLQQVLLNLIINGCDSMQSIPAEERRIVIETALDGTKFARVSVIDHGSGIAPGMMERMFEPFFTTKSNGLGMGLSICRAIVKAHGGNLWAENNPGRGATFHFTVRVDEAPEHART